MREINVSRTGDPVHARDKAPMRETPAQRGRVNRYAIDIKIFRRGDTPHFALPLVFFNVHLQLKLRIWQKYVCLVSLSTI